jgi:hypothetical protein
MALINLEEFKSVLGIGDIYPDAEVQQVADAAQSIILSYLTFNDAAIESVKLENNLATYDTTNQHAFAIGSVLTVTGCGSPFDGSKTVSEIGKFYFRVAITNAEIELKPIKPNGRALLTSQAALYDTDDSVREATMAVAVDIWTTRMGTMGQQGVDFQPAPYRLSRGMITRISGLLAKSMDVEGLVG